jgi:NAD(P)-dependent dehydrogenase (short-subunit alcohol dehydrogenase family)
MQKVAIVTGGGSGIGRTAAHALSRAGYAVVVAGQRVEALEETAAGRFGSLGPIQPIAANVTDQASVRALFRQTVEAFGRVDLLFNNAGIGAPPVEFDEISLEQWRKVVDVNLTGSFLCAQEAFRQMKSQDPQGGRIINNGSVSAHAPRPNSAPYTATKHAITGLTKSLSLDGRKYDIACGQIDIGNAATELTARVRQGVPQASGALAVEPTMDVAHVGEAIVFMAELPLDTNVQFLTLMATKMPFVGRG